MGGLRAFELMELALGTVSLRLPYERVWPLPQIARKQRYHAAWVMMKAIADQVEVGDVVEGDPELREHERTTIRAFKAWVRLMTKGDWKRWYHRGLSKSRSEQLLSQVWGLCALQLLH